MWDTLSGCVTLGISKRIALSAFIVGAGVAGSVVCPAIAAWKRAMASGAGCGISLLKGLAWAVRPAGSSSGIRPLASGMVKWGIAIPPMSNVTMSIISFLLSSYEVFQLSFGTRVLLLCVANEPLGLVFIDLHSVL